MPGATSEKAVAEPGGARPRWSVLGPLTGAVGGVPIDTGPPMRRALLAILVAHAGAPVETESLIDALWPDAPPSSARNVVFKHVGSLRRTVAPGLPRRAQGDWLVATGAGYRVDPAHADLDVVHFRELIAAARREDEPRRRLDVLISALEIWRGRAGADVGIDLGQVAVFGALDREHATAVLEAAHLATSSGRAGEVVNALEFAISLHPNDELLHAALVRALIRTGHRGEALDRYSAVRQRMLNELGVEPGAELRSAQAEVFEDGDQPLPAIPRPAQLPSDIPTFAGRVHHLKSIEALAEDGTGSPVVVVTGAPGVGKTSLAVRAAHLVQKHFPDGQLSVDLRGFDGTESPRDPRAVLGSLLEALSIPAARLPRDLDSRASLFRSVMASRRMLVLLDNAVNSRQVRPLLPGVTGSMTIVTSRAPLRALAMGSTRHVIELVPLDRQEANGLLSRRIGDERVRRERAAVNRLLHASGGLPLALALTASRAARLSHVPLDDLADELARERRVLDGFADETDDSIDLRSVFSWSYDGLSVAAARLFRLLSQHPGPTISVPSVAALLVTDDRAANRALQLLLEAGMVTEQRPGAFVMHQLLRAYAGELFGEDASERTADVLARLEQYAVTTALGASQALTPERLALGDPGLPRPSNRFTDSPSARAWFALERDLLIEMVAGTRSGLVQPQSIWRIAWALERHLEFTGHWQDLVAVEIAAVRAAQEFASPMVQAATHRSFGRGLGLAGRAPEARREVESAVEILRSVVDEVGGPARLSLAETYRALSWADEQDGSIEDALLHAQAALNTYTADERTPAVAFALNAVGWYEALLQRYDDAEAHCEEALAMLEQYDGHESGRADAHSSLGHVALRRGLIATAVRHQRKAVRLWSLLGDRLGQAQGKAELAEAFEAGGHPDFALALSRDALQVEEALEHPGAAGLREHVAALANRTA